MLHSQKVKTDIGQKLRSGCDFLLFALFYVQCLFDVYSIQCQCLLPSLRLSQDMTLMNAGRSLQTQSGSDRDAIPRALTSELKLDIFLAL